MKDPIHVVGAGLSGLIAANLLVARGHGVVVWERQEALPNNHNSVLRFRSPALGEALGIPFRKVQTVNNLYGITGGITEAMNYSRATTGIARTDRSIVRLLSGPKVYDRWIAPFDFRNRLLERIENRLWFGVSFDFVSEASREWSVISTAALNISAKKAEVSGIDEQSFRAIPQMVITGTAKAMDAYGSVYSGEPDVSELPWTRVSFSGSEVSMEVSSLLFKDAKWTDSEIMDEFRLILRDDFYIKVEPKAIWRSDNARILPIDERWRKRAIMELTDRYNLYSFGRFAVWRPGLLLDDLLGDFDTIMRMIDGDSAPKYQSKGA